MTTLRLDAFRLEDPRSDDELLRTVGDEPDAFRIFFARHERLLHALAVRRLGDRALADHVMARVFATARARCGGFDPAHGSARAWLLGILAAQTWSALRREASVARARRRLRLAPIVAEGRVPAQDASPA